MIDLAELSICFAQRCRRPFYGCGKSSLCRRDLIANAFFEVRKIRRTQLDQMDLGMNRPRNRKAHQKDTHAETQRHKLNPGIHSLPCLQTVYRSMRTSVRSSTAPSGQYTRTA